MLSTSGVNTVSAADSDTVPIGCCKARCEYCQPTTSRSAYVHASFSCMLSVSKQTGWWTFLPLLGVEKIITLSLAFNALGAEACESPGKKNPRTPQP